MSETVKKQIIEKVKEIKKGEYLSYLLVLCNEFLATENQTAIDGE